MILETLVVGPLEANCYLVGCDRTRRGFIVDPGAEAQRILEAVERLELKVEYLFNTHGHVDHIAANAALQEATGAPIAVHEADGDLLEHPHPFWASLVGGIRPSSPDVLMADGDSFQVGDLTVRVMHTPGHSPGGVCLLVEDAIFTGDTLFASSIGRTDLPGGSMETLQESLRRLREEVPPETPVLPGHRGPSTMAHEIRANPYIQQL
ncbi:MAG: MBL fold metallo-hydrolase [Armatimonadota bacterium]|nr:MBL fold metallo-hydrolase [Armatimonadota bacterium]